MAALTGALLGGLAATAGGIGNYVANMDAADRAQVAQDKSLQEWLALQIPDPKEQELALQQFVSQGKLEPKLEQAIQQRPSEFEKVRASVTHKAAQNRALASLEKLGYEGGLSLQDKADLQDAQIRSNTEERSDRNAIIADMARRGQGGSGFALQAQLANQQGAADRDAQSSLSVAAQARARALEAIQGAGTLAGQQRSQDVGEQQAVARAKDAINQFNTSNLQDVQMRNINAQNKAQAQNLSEAQRLSDMNTNLSNEQQKYNKGLQQQQFENQMAIAKGKSNVYGNQAQMDVSRGQKEGNFFSNLGEGVKDTAAAIQASGIKPKTTENAYDPQLDGPVYNTKTRRWEY